MRIQTFIGPLIHCDSQGQLVLLENAQLDIKDGKIERLHLVAPLANGAGGPGHTVRRLKDGQFLIPGFIDGHIHAVQFPNLGLGYDKCLLDWLEVYTFPLEKKYADRQFAATVFQAVVNRTLKMGTTTACYYGSLHAGATLILAEAAAACGQRALVGKVNMNVCQMDDDYCETFGEALVETRAFIENVVNIGSPLVQPVITPRFALSCDLELMKKLGDLARDKNIHVQTHISENKEEVKAVQAQYTDFSSYAEVYDAAGLLTNKTVLAHGIHLTDDELNLISRRESSIIHCPSSNTCLKSGLCDVRRLQGANVKVGLGTDVSGGNFPSILDAMRAALQVSTHLSFSKLNYKPLTYKDAFYLATLGGAEALAMNERIGNFDAGKDFDALVIDLTSPNSVLDNLQDYTLDEKLQRFIFSGDDRNITEVYVAGRRVV